MSSGQIQKVKEWMTIKNHQFTPWLRNRAMGIIAVHRICDEYIFEKDAPVIIVDRKNTHGFNCFISAFFDDCVNVLVAVCEKNTREIVGQIKVPINSLRNNY